MLFGDPRIGWCRECRIRIPRIPKLDADGAVVDELDPVCRRCGENAELIEPRALYERSLQEQAAATRRLESSSATRGESLRLHSVVSMRQASRALHLRPSTVAAHVELGNLKAVVIGKHTRITHRELDRVLTEGLPSLPGEQPYLAKTPRRQTAKTRGRSLKARGERAPTAIASEILKARL